MIITKYIPEICQEVEFDVLAERIKPQRQTLECEPLPGGIEIIDVRWDCERYTTEENEIIDIYAGNLEL